MATIDEAQLIVGKLMRDFDACGYMLALYGSVLRQGQGNDVDLFAVPWRPFTDHMSLIAIMERQGFGLVGGAYHGQMGTYAQVFTCPHTGALVDLQIREVRHASA